MEKLINFINKASYEVFLISVGTLKALVAWVNIGLMLGVIGFVAFYVFVSFYGWLR